MKKIAILTGLLLANLASDSASAQTIILQDNFNVTSNLTGFALGAGVNAGITTTPPATRLTGTAAAGLRYFAADTTKPATNYSILNAGSEGKMKVIASPNAQAGRVSLTDNLTAFNFAPFLGSIGATPAAPAQYEIAIKMAVNSAAAQRASFAISTTDGNNGTWDFGFQLHRLGTDAFYTVSHRVNSASSGTVPAANATAVIETLATTYGNEVSFLMKVWDAGTETGANYNSRLELYADGVLIYETANDPTIDNKWRFDAANRFILWDIAGGGSVTYDDLTVTSIFAPTAPNNDKVWTGGGTDNNWSTGANWGGSAPTNGQGLIFAGTTRQSNFNDIIDLTVPFLSFSNGGFTVSGSAFLFDSALTNLAGTTVLAADLSFVSAGGKAWWLLGGGELILSNTTTVPVVGDHAIYGGGTLLQKGAFNIGLTNTANPAFIVNEGRHVIDGTNFYSKGGYRIGSVATGAGAKTILTNNATFTLAASGSNLRVGDSANPITAELQIHNSLLSMAGGSFGIGYATGSTGLVTQVGGTNTGGFIVFSDAGDAKGTYTIKDGTLETFQIREDTAAGSSTLQFDNAVLRTLFGANTNFMAALNSVQILSGGLTFDVVENVTVSQNIGGAGALTKTGTAALTMTGNPNYIGGTIVQEGMLILPTGKTNALLQVGNSAQLHIVLTNANSSRFIGNLTLGNGVSSTLSFDLGSYGNPVAPVINASSLSASGTVTVDVTSGVPLTLGQFVLVDYVGAISGANTFVLGAVAASLPPGATATLVHNTANSSLDLRISDGSVLSFTSVSRQGNNVVMNGTGGVEGTSYIVLTTTDIGLPMSSWTPVTTNLFGAGGSFGHTNSTAASATFFSVKRP